jgi:hypothetical protein
MENKKEIIIGGRSRPFWQLIIAAFFYTMCLLVFANLVFFFPDDIVSANGGRVIGAKFWLATLFFIPALKLSVVKTIFINLENEKLKTQFSVGLIRINFFSKIPELEYVSIFKDTKAEIFEVNLWYKGNKHFNVANFIEFQPAYDFGFLFSNKLNIDLLDATEKGNSQWIDKTKI